MKNKPVGKMNTYYNSKRERYRCRLNNVHPDQLFIYQKAFELARKDTGSEFDAVALDAICQHFLATYY